MDYPALIAVDNAAANISFPWQQLPEHGEKFNIYSVSVQNQIGKMNVASKRHHHRRPTESEKHTEMM